MAGADTVTLTDLLLLFLCLEIVTMLGLYCKQDKLLARFNPYRNRRAGALYHSRHEEMDEWRQIGVADVILDAASRPHQLSLP